MLKIKQASNGVSLEWDEEGYHHVELFTFDDLNLDGLARMLYTVNEQCGILGSKHDKYRIRISIEHGTGYECNDDKCNICKGDK